MYCHGIKMKPSRIFWPSAMITKANMSTNSNSKNHYETLELKQSATHNEIKSAYYKLTMQYHPDKNKDDSAKEKFRHITRAYEILGNSTSRKNYDRKIGVSKIRLTPQRGPVIVKPPTMNIYKSRMATYTEPTNTNDPSYNYPEWMRTHYVANFRHRQRAAAKIINTIRENDEQQSAMLLLGLAMFGVIFVMLLCVQTTNYYDVPAELSKNKSSQKNRENSFLSSDKVPTK